MNAPTIGRRFDLALQRGQNIAQCLRAAASSFPDKPAIVFENQTLSYRDFDRAAQRSAGQLIAMGVAPGERVALHMLNSSELAIAYFACFYAGAVAVPINIRMKGPEVAYVLKHSGVSIYLGQPDLFREIESICGDCSSVRQFLTDWQPRNGAAVRETPRLIPGHADEAAVIMYTSGSTARPKGVVHSHRTCRNAARGLNIDEPDVVAMMTSMAHAAAFMMLLAGIEACATAVPFARFDPEATLDMIAKHRCSVVLGLTAMFPALIAAQDAQTRSVVPHARFFATGDAVPAAFKRAFARSFSRPLHELFGMTEVGLIAANFSLAEDPLDSFGRPVCGVEVVLADNDGGITSGDRGEMMVRSAATMLGYWDDPKATADVMRNGWFRTGDLVRRDSLGYLSFEGRRKEVIVRGGSNISPQEVEAVLCEHPGVREAGVVGKTDSLLGERVVAFVKAAPDSPPTEHELIAFVTARIANYKVPEEIVFLDALPKGQTGKIARRALKDMLPECAQD